MKREKKAFTWKPMSKRFEARFDQARRHIKYLGYYRVCTVGPVNRFVKGERRIAIGFRCELGYRSITIRTVYKSRGYKLDNIDCGPLESRLMIGLYRGDISFVDTCTFTRYDTKPGDKDYDPTRIQQAIKMLKRMMTKKNKNNDLLAELIDFLRSQIE